MCCMPPTRDTLCLIEANVLNFQRFRIPKESGKYVIILGRLSSQTGTNGMVLQFYRVRWSIRLLSLKKNKITNFWGQEMWGHWYMRANRLNSSQDDLLLKKSILISHSSSLSLSLLYTWVQTHTHTHRYPWTWPQHVYLLHVSVFAGVTFDSSQLKRVVFLSLLPLFSGRSSSCKYGFIFI